MLHSYRELDVIGSWDYSYSVAFYADGKMIRTDKELFSREMYTETDITMNDDETIRISIEDTQITGT